MFKDDTLERLSKKTDRHHWVLSTCTPIMLCPWWRRKPWPKKCSRKRKPRILWSMASSGINASRKKKEQAGAGGLVRVKLTIRAPEDLDYDTIREAKKVIVARFCWEALR